MLTDVRDNATPLMQVATPLNQAGPAPGRRLRRRMALAAACATLTAFVATSFALFIWPATDAPRHVDAVLVLDGPNEAAREHTAFRLVEQGYAPVLLFSQGRYHSTPCPVLRKVDVVCFVPSPGRTVGEIAFAERYAHAHGWETLMVVAGHEQATRARLLLQRCFPGRALVVPAPIRVLTLPYDVLYEWGALAKALLIDRGC